MISRYTSVLVSFLLLSFSLQAHENIFDKSMEDILAMESELKAEIGSRDGARNCLDSNTPVDVITYKQIESSGLLSLTDVLRYFVAGFNAPETSVADGSDHVRAFTLRGMSPDQVLVLINGKRVHTSALLHVNGVIGRGSSHVDLDTIALGAIDRVEILRDGAAAQYGSDAISGVINIILKGMGHKSSISTHYGQRSKGDGQKVEAEAFISRALKNDGFVNLSMEAIGEEQTQRAGEDHRVSPPTITSHVGIPESKSYKAMLNAEILNMDDLSVYSNALVNYRDSKASAFYRPAASNLVTKQGFLPQIEANILDYALSVGVKGTLGEHSTWNLSNSYGVNEFNYHVEDSMNYTLGTTSPTSFDNGGLKFVQNTTTLDFKKSTDILKIAGGIEFRYENYKINAGDEASYTNNNNFSIPSGSQGFAGFSPENEVDESRTNYALYVDSIVDLSKNLQLEVLARYEEYSDFGESTNAKFALSYKLNPKTLLRMSGSTGFRAPSLAQSFYSQTSSFVNSSTGELTTEGTFKVNHALSQELGAKDLKSERSKNLSMGTVYQPSKNLSFMFDLFFIEVNDRILLTQDIQTTKEQTLTYGVTAARFFTNAAQTKTKGVDVRANYQHFLHDNSKLDFSFWFNYTDNKIIDSRDDTSTYVEKVRIEDGQPKASVRLLTNYQINKFNTALNVSHFGEYYQAIGNEKYKFNPMTAVDLDISYNITKKSKVAIGGNNIFNAVPNKWNNLNGDFYGTNGIKPYSRYSPLGYSGAYYYLRASMEF